MDNLIPTMLVISFATMIVSAILAFIFTVLDGETVGRYPILDKLSDYAINLFCFSCGCFMFFIVMFCISICIPIE